MPFQTHDRRRRPPCRPECADTGIATLGIRPEDVTFEPQGSGHVAITGTIDLVENLGNDSIVYLMVEGQPLTGTDIIPVFEEHAGASITAYVKNFHLFINENRIPLPSP